MGHTIYLALGTNLGDRFANLRSAIAALPSHVRVLMESPIYETLPWGYTDQPAFLNMALKARTYLTPLALLSHLKHLETELGRTPTFHYGPRQIDIDILFYDNLVIETSGLVIPHPRLHERGFVLVPLADIAPDLCHPILDKTIHELLTSCDTTGIKRHEPIT